jgi:hypothetical protein
MIKRLLLMLGLVTAFGLSGPATNSVAAFDPFGGVDCTGGQAGQSGAKPSDSAACTGKVGADENPVVDTIRKITNIVAFAAGAAAAILMVVGGIRYITSNGDANNIKSAKNTVVYSLIGLAVIVLARSLIVFVLGKF